MALSKCHVDPPYNISQEEATVLLRVLGGTTLPWSEGALQLMNAADSETCASQPLTHLTCLSVFHLLPPTLPAQRQIYCARIP